MPDFEAPLGVYNLRPDNMHKWRAARARAASGVGTAHVSAVGDSITYGAAATGVSVPKPVNSWPGRLRRMLAADYGNGGSGVATAWDTLTTRPLDDPRWTWVGSIEDRVAGAHRVGAKRWLDASGANYVEFTDVCTEFWIYSYGLGSRPQVQVDGGPIKLIAGAPNVDPALTDYDPLPGYQANGANGQIVTVIPAGPLGTHTLRLRAPSNGTSYVGLLGVRARAGAGVEVSNLGRSSLRTNEFISDDPVSGVAGMAVSLDMVRSDLAVLLLAMNDFQAHIPVATFKANVTTLVQRQKSTATYGARGDVLLVTCPQPDYTQIPADHVLTPPMADYYAAMYEVAAEQDVPLLDLSKRWTSYPVSQPLGYFADVIHPGDLGSEDIARAVYNVLAAI